MNGELTVLRRVTLEEMSPRLTLVVASLFAASIAVAFWLLALPEIHMAEMNDLGLISVLPWVFLMALGAATAAFVLALYAEPVPVPLVFLIVFLLIMLLYGTPALIGEAPRFAVTWRHFGVMETIQRTGESDPFIDAYFNWPGFFALGAFLTEISGAGNAVVFGTWASVAFNLLWLLPLVMIFRSFTNNERHTWLAVWLFYAANWIGQDYFSPQALNYFLYLVILGIVIAWFRVTPPAPPRLLQRDWKALSRLTDPVLNWLALPDKAGTPIRAGQRAALVPVIIVLFASIVASHQLTPFAVLLAITALVLFNRVSLRDIPLIMTIIVTLWVVFMATQYMKGHFRVLIDNLGNLGSSVNANVSERVTGSSDHQLVIRLRMLMTLGLWMLAGLGSLRRLRQRQGDATPLLLAGAPFALLGMQNYGGEVLLRIYLFNLPFVAFLGAGLFFSRRTKRRERYTPILVGLLSLALLGGFLVTRFGNERMEYKTADEIAGVRAAYQLAPGGSLLLALNPNIAWKFQDYEKYKHRIASQQLESVTADGVIGLLDDSHFDNTYLIITRSQRAYAEMMLGLSPAEQTQFEQALEASPKLKMVYSTKDATIFARARNKDDAAFAGPVSPSKSSSPGVAVGITVFCVIFAVGSAGALWLALPDVWASVTIAIALGVALLTLLTTTAVLIHLWHPMVLAGIVVGGSMLVNGLYVVTTGRRRRAREHYLWQSDTSG